MLHDTFDKPQQTIVVKVDSIKVLDRLQLSCIGLAMQLPYSGAVSLHRNIVWALVGRNVHQCMGDVKLYEQIQSRWHDNALQRRKTCWTRADSESTRDFGGTW